MIGFVKGNIEGLNIEGFQVNPYLQWESKVDCETPDIFGKFAQARYKGLLFKIIFPTEKRKHKMLTVEESLHKYWNNGEHNFNDFNLEALDSVLDDLKLKFRIQPQHLFLTQIETGVNINPNYKTKPF